MSEEFDVVIVGGGAAGIGAACRLAKSNVSAIILEAGPRLGGRAWTHRAFGHDIDLGCEWFHSAERNAWVSIAEAVGIPIDRSVAAWGNQYRDLGFSKAERADAWQAFASWTQRMRSSPRSDRAADALLPDCPWNDYIRTIVGFISGGILENMSIADYLAYDDASSDNNWRAPGGYGALVANSVPARISVKLDAPVESIALEKDVKVSTPAGVLRARAAILTVSTAVLAGDTLQLPAALAPWREAARLLPLGRNEKLFLEIVGEGAFVTETQLLGDPRSVLTGSYYIRPLGTPLIECFFGGEGARVVEAESPAAAFDFALAQLCALFGADLRAALRPLAASKWSHMKHIGGAYSYALPGHAAARAALARPFEGKVFFAGEATSARDFSTAHGAHDSGVRAADEVLAALTPGPAR